MTNLIPPDAKASVKKEYWVRTLAVWGFLLSLCCIAITISLFPTYVLYDVQLSAFANEQTRANNEKGGVYENARTSIERANAVAQQLNNSSTPILASKLLDEVRSTHGSSITIDSFVYAVNGGSVSSIQISGTAATRSSLANFAEALKANPYFTTAEVPVESLIRENDLPFNIEVGVAKP